MPKSAEHGVVTADGRLDRGVVQDISAGNGKTLMLCAELGRVPDKRRYMVATLESLFNERAASTAGCTDDQESHETSFMSAERDTTVRRLRQRAQALGIELVNRESGELLEGGVSWETARRLSVFRPRLTVVAPGP